MNNLAATVLAGLALLLAGPATAAMYRCGNVFQDRPCEAVDQQQLIKPGRGAGRPAPAAEPPAATASAPSVAASAPSSPASARREDPAAARAPAASASGTLRLRPGAASPVCANLAEQHAALDARIAAAARPETRVMLGRQKAEVEKNQADARCQ